MDGGGAAVLGLLKTTPNSARRAPLDPPLRATADA